MRGLAAAVRTLGAVAVVLGCTGAAAAQSPAPVSVFELGAQVASGTVGEFDSNDFGFGGRVSWLMVPYLGFEGEVNWFPADFPASRPFSRMRVEGLWGVTVGPRIGRFRPFGKFGIGYLDYHEAPGPLVCLAIYPPPLSCTLGAGHTLVALMFGGGLEATITPRTFIRFDAGDRPVKYPGPSSNDGVTHDGSFWGQSFRFTAGAGVRF